MSAEAIRRLSWLPALTDAFCFATLLPGAGPVLVAAIISSVGRNTAFNIATAGWVPCALLLALPALTLARDEAAMQARLRANIDRHVMRAVASWGGGLAGTSEGGAEEGSLGGGDVRRSEAALGKGVSGREHGSTGAAKTNGSSSSTDGGVEAGANEGGSDGSPRLQPLDSQLRPVVRRR